MALQTTRNDLDMIPEQMQPSKSELKRRSRRKQALVDALAKLPPKEFERLHAPDGLAQEVATLRSLPAGGARQRRIRYGARQLSPDTEALVSDALASLRDAHRQRTARFHRWEAWRERLLREGDTALNALVGEYPHADRQQLRRLLRAARIGDGGAKATRAYRQLFHDLTELCDV